MLFLVVILAAISDWIEGHKPSTEEWLMALAMVLCDMVTIAATIYFWEF